jgi:hypothetical protein
VQPDNTDEMHSKGTDNAGRGAGMLPNVVAAFEEKVRQENDTGNGKTVEQLHVRDCCELECHYYEKVALDICDG